MRKPGDPQVTPSNPEQHGCGRDPEDRPIAPQAATARDKMLDKTLADSFPSSDPPSTLPDPSDDSFGETVEIKAGGEAGVESPYDRRTHADTEDAEGQPLPVSNPFDRQPQPGQEPLPGKPDRAA